MSLAVLELYSIRLKIIRFYSERLSRNFIAAFDCITAMHYCYWFYGLVLCFACVIIVPFDCKFAGSKFIGICVYVNGLGYRCVAAAKL